MSAHPAIAPGRVAVITGAASGIGLGAALKFAALGMKVAMADANAEGLRRAAAQVATVAKTPGDVISHATDVSKFNAVEGLRDAVLSSFGEIGLLMNNAGIGESAGVFGDPAIWRRLIDINLFGVINGVQIFGPVMIAQGTPCAIVNTGSKQGITCPPGNTAYNVSKAGVKVVTESLAHELREIPDCKVTAHLLIPGFTFTGMTSSATEKPPAAWTPEQVVDFMFASLARGDFYILCPDNDVDRATDERRIRWAAGDIVENRPALSRWHPDWKERFADFMAGDG